MGDIFARTPATGFACIYTVISKLQKTSDQRLYLFKKGIKLHITALPIPQPQLNSPFVLCSAYHLQRLDNLEL